MTELNILVVEDVPTAAMIASIILKKLGCNVTIAETGEVAISQFKEKKFDLIFMDLGLPDIDGRTVTVEMRKLEKAAHCVHTPIVALTAHAGNELKNTIADFGMDGFFSKPLTTHLARDILNHYVKKDKE